MIGVYLFVDTSLCFTSANVIELPYKSYIQLHWADQGKTPSPEHLAGQSVFRELISLITILENIMRHNQNKNNKKLGSWGQPAHEPTLLISCNS